MITDSIDHDAIRQKQGNQTMLPFSGGDMDRSGIRLTRAEFARFMEVSKQAVTDWVKSGKVVLGADGRLDPRQAVSQLLRSTDPARLRSKVLAPLVKDVGKFQQRIAELESDLSAAREQASFDYGASCELLDILAGFESRLRAEWPALRGLDTDTALDALFAWMEEAKRLGADPDLEILSFVSMSDASETALPGAPENIEWVEGLVDPAMKIISSDEPGDLAWIGLDSETAAEIERAAAEFNQLDSAARAATETGAGE